MGTHAARLFAWVVQAHSFLACILGIACTNAVASGINDVHLFQRQYNRAHKQTQEFLRQAGGDPKHEQRAHPSASPQVHPDQVLAVGESGSTGSQHRLAAPQEVGTEIVICIGGACNQTVRAQQRSRTRSVPRRCLSHCLMDGSTHAASGH